MATIKQRAVTLGTLILFFFAVGTARAQEKVRVATGTEMAQVAENVEAQTMAVTVETLIAKWAMEKALRKNEEFEVMKRPVEGRAAIDGIALADQRWFPVNPHPSAPNDPTAATITGSPSGSLPSPTDCNTPFSGPMCSVRIDVEGIDDPELATILNNISNNTQTYTVQDLIDAGASTSVLVAKSFDPDID